MFRTSTKLAAAIGLAILGAGASAQFITGEGMSSPPAWESFKLNKKTRVKLDFKNANIDLVIGFISKTSGVTIVKDPTLVGPITVTSATSVPLTEAFDILNSVLTMKGYSISKEGLHLVIKQNQGRGRTRGGTQNPGDTGTPVDTGNPFSGGGVTPQPKLELKVYVIQYASAAQVARVVNDVFSPDTNQPFGGMQFGGRGGPGGGRNNRLATLLQGGTPNAFGTVKASSDDYSNTVIVNAAAKDQAQVADIIKQIDKQADAPTQSKVFKLQYAVATDLAAVVQNVLTQNAPKGKGGSTNPTNPFVQMMSRMQPGGANQYGNVVADTRTNSLVVTSTDDNIKLIGNVLNELDKPVKYESTTFVFPLANARADVLATLLTQAFGTRSGTGATTGRTTQPTGTTPFGQTINTSTSTGTTSTSGGGNRGLTGQVAGGDANNLTPNQLELALQNPGADSGELLTQINAQGFGGFGGMMFGGGAQRSTTGSTTQTNGVNSQGQLVPVKDLAGQVTIIADPNTNSLIVVTLPENAAMIKEMLAKLDKIPEQVMIETIIVEATLDASDQFGVEWNYVQNNVGGAGNTINGGQTFGLQTSTTPATGFKFTMTGGNLTSFLNLLRTDTKFQVLSTPRIFTANNSTAQINISQSIPYVLSTQTDSLGNQLFNYGFLNVGIVLTVLPRITADGYVAMDITQTANDLQGYTSFNAPIVNQREATTSVAVKDGETIILGGIIRNQVTSTVNKIPLLGDIPILGNLFRTTSKGKQKTELLVFLTPRVIRSPEEARKLLEDSKKQMSPETLKSYKSVSVAPPPLKGDDKGQSDGKPTGGS